VTDLPDYYAVLGVPPAASREEIHIAYRRLARRHHPDVNKKDTATNLFMYQLNEAYGVLSDPERRAAYDRQRRAQASARDRASGNDPRERPERKGYRSPGRLSVPDWLARFATIEGRLRRKLAPLATYIGILTPVLILAVLLILGFLTYQEIRARPLVRALGGVDGLLGAFGTVILLFLCAWFLIWDVFQR
jgi:hypothetical protein